MSHQIASESNIERIKEQWELMLQNYEPNLIKRMGDIMMNLKNEVTENKLKGQVLNSWTGKLISSIIELVLKEDTLIIGILGAQGAIAPYAKILEEGGIIPTTFVEPINKRALHWVGGGKDFFSTGHWLPPRSVAGRFYIHDTVVEKQNMIEDILKKMITLEGRS